MANLQRRLPHTVRIRLGAALRDVGDRVVGKRDDGVGQPLGAGTGGPRPAGSGAQRTRCTRMRWNSSRSSIIAMTRIGPLHFGCSKGSASYTLLISCAQTALALPAEKSGRSQGLL